MWGAGAVLAIIDAGIAHEVESIASVSGGSITNAVVAHAGELRAESTAGKVGPALAGMARTIADDGLFWFGPATTRWAMQFLLAAGFAIGSIIGLVASLSVVARDAPVRWFWIVPAVLALVWVIGRKRLAKDGPESGGMPMALQAVLLVGLVTGGALVVPMTLLTTNAHGRPSAVLACVAVLIGTVLIMWFLLAVFARRSKAVDEAIAATFFARGALAPALAAVDRDVHHVFCTTDLMSGDQLYLTPRMVSGYRVGFGTPGQLALSTAVQCSACLPGGFVPRVLDNTANAAFHLDRKYDIGKPGFPTSVEHLMVNDGGVYDNMADQWHQGFARRAERAGFPARAINPELPVDLLVVANAGGALSWKDKVPGRLFRDVPGLKRTIDILYDVSTSNRRQRLVEDFDLAGSGSGIAGVLTHVRTSPVALALRFTYRGTDAQKAEASAALSMLRELQTDDGWVQLADRNAQVKTTLGRLTRAQVVDLAWHAYLLTRVGLWIAHGIAPATRAELARETMVAKLGL